MAELAIRENIPQYMADLKAWLAEVRDQPLEGMSDFFSARLEGYEDHMALWQRAYEKAAELIPPSARNLLDLGCGTGLELDALFQRRQDVAVTGVDLCPDMLERLREKHPQVETICGDYFQVELGQARYDCAISFESLHHFRPEKKQELFARIHQALRPGGVFLEVDYLACCQEEEQLLMDFCWNKRRRQGIDEAAFVHFDTPLTVDHERTLLQNAGFSRVAWIDCIQGASFLWCEK